MIRLTKSNARKYGVRIPTVQGSFQQLDNLINSRFDAIVVMGNSLTHLLTKTSLKRSLQSFSNLLESGGVLIAQCLNYERILATHDRLQNAKEVGEKKIVRYYDFDGEGILFRIKTIDRKGEKERERTETLRLRPVMKEELSGVLQQVGFHDIQVFGGISLEPFDARSSKDLVIAARKASAG